MSKSTFPFVGYPLSVLSFGRCKKFESLKLFFLSEDWSNQIFLRLYEWFTNSLSEPSLLFQTSAITVFTHFNLLLQRDEPCIHILKSVIEGLGRNLVKQVIEADQLKDVSSVFDLDLEDDQICKVPRSIFLEHLQNRHEIDCYMMVIFEAESIQNTLS